MTDEADGDEYVDTGELVACPATKAPCNSLLVGAGWDCEAHGCWVRHGHEDNGLEQREEST